MYINRISEILKNRGIDNMRPSDQQLMDWGATIHTWNKWVRRSSDPELYHLEGIADFLGCSIDELIERKLKVASSGEE